MPTDKRRADGRRRAWGRGPVILRFEPLEDRQLLASTPAAAAAPPLPDLVGQSFQTPSSLDWGATFQAQGVVVNRGTAAASTPFKVDIYASPTPAIGPNAVLLGEATVAAGLQPGARATFNESLTLPSSPVAGLDASGAFYVAMAIDPQNTVSETTKQNNAGTGAGFDYELVTPPVVPTASLVGTGLSLTPDVNNWGGSIELSQQISNVGTGNAPATRALVVLTPSGSTPGGPADVTLGSVSVPAIPAGQSVSINPTFSLPTVPPSGLSAGKTFTLSVIQDGDYVTNQRYPHAARQGTGQDRVTLTVTDPNVNSTRAASGAKPDLAAANVTVASQNIKWGQNFQVNATLGNLGSVSSGPFKVRYLLVGPGGQADNSLFLADATVSGLAAGGTQAIVTTLKLPASPPTGAVLNSASQARVAVVIDPENTIDEPSKANNGAVSNLITLSVVGTDGRSTPVAATATTPSPTANKATAKPAASKNSSTPKPAASPKHANVKAKKTTLKSVSGSVEHNLKIFPSKVSKFFKKTFKGK